MPRNETFIGLGIAARIMLTGTLGSRDNPVYHPPLLQRLQGNIEAIGRFVRTKLILNLPGPTSTVMPEHTHTEIYRLGRKSNEAVITAPHNGTVIVAFEGPDSIGQPTARFATVTLEHSL